VTHGEEWFYQKQHFIIVDGYLNTSSNLPNRMAYAEAIKYYSNKIRNYFNEQLTVKDFDRVEDYFCFFEARKILKQLGGL
jgi:hypothetical protein